MFTIFGAMSDRRFPCLSKETGRFTTVFVDTRLWKTKHPQKRFQNFRHSYELLTDRIEIHQSEPLAWPSDLLYVMLAGFDWWISIRYVENKEDWRKFRKRFRGCFVFQSRVSTKTAGITSIQPIFTLEWKEALWEQCLAQEYNTMSPARARTRTALTMKPS